MKLLSAILLCSIFLVLPAAAVANPPTEAEGSERPRARIAEVKVLPEGALLFAVRIHAPRDKSLRLAGVTPRGFEAEDDLGPMPFSLAGSTLSVAHANQVIKPYPTVPQEPYFGPIDYAGDLAPGAWIQLGLAFPPLPDPPKDPDGNALPYEVVFRVPELRIETKLILDPVTFQPISLEGASSR